ncbi:Cleavage stimulation factor subunit 77-like protein [Drosera capensis]
MGENKYDVRAAEILASEAMRSKITEAVPIYEQLLSTYPTAAKFWKQYVEAQMAVKNDDATRQIFSRCLLSCLHIPLWRCYIHFISKVNEKKGTEGVDETRKAFEFMINHVGVDIASGPIWMEYINLLKSIPAHTPQAETQLMSAIRKAYQKAVVTPCHHLEQLWRDYESFENKVSRALAKGLLSDFQPKFNSARAVYREKKKYVDEIDWNMLAIPSTGSEKEEQQWIAWRRLLAFDKENPQRIDSTSSNKRIILAYEQCLMYLYHYPDIWYDYAAWHAKNGTADSAVKVLQRALKALPDSDLLKYAFAELEESRGSFQSARRIYESVLGDGANVPALVHIQFIRFLRRTEGVEAARKYFLDIRASPSCTYEVYVSYALMTFCLDKDAKVAHNIFEAGMKQFMLEPRYILEYADFLLRLNDERNTRALFERALSSLPPEQSVEVWKRFAEFEQMYGDLNSMLKVEQRRKEALTRPGEEGALGLENSLQDIVSRYSFRNLYPCSSKQLELLTRQEWLAKNMNKKGEIPNLANGFGSVDKSSSGLTTTNSTLKSVHVDSNPTVTHYPMQNSGPGVISSVLVAGLPVTHSTPSASRVGTNSALDGILKAAPPALAAFIANLPGVEVGPLPDADFVLSICMQSNFPSGWNTKSGAANQNANASEVSGSTRSYSSAMRTRDRHSGKRKHAEKQEDDTTTVQSLPLPRDAFRLRQMQKARTGSTSQNGSTSYGSAFSGEHSASTT